MMILSLISVRVAFWGFLFVLWVLFLLGFVFKVFLLKKSVLGSYGGHGNKYSNHGRPKQKNYIYLQ